MILRMVDFPAPLRPSSPIRSPSATWRVTPWMALDRPYEAVTSVSSSMLHSEVGLHDLWVAEDRRAVAGRQDTSEIQHRDVVGHAADEPDVVFHDEDRQAPRVPQLPHQSRQFGGFVTVHPCGRLVQHE